MDAQATVSGLTVYLHTGNEPGEHLTLTDAVELAEQLKKCVRHIRSLDVVSAAPPAENDAQPEPDPEPEPKPKRAARKPRASRKKA